MSAKMNLNGRRFGKLKVIKSDYRRICGKHQHGWVCKCDCGNERFYTTKELVYYKVKDCGHCAEKKVVEKTVLEEKPVVKEKPVEESKVVKKKKPVVIKKDLHYKKKKELKNEGSKSS